MAHVWVEDQPEQWSALPLDDQPLDLSANPPAASSVPVEELAGPCLFPAGGRWLVASPEGAVRVNGAPVALGIRVLRDRDEILAAGRRIYFSTERPPRIEVFPGAGRTLYCPRCKKPISKESPAVRCPGCGCWHHQDQELPCWEYAAQCATCPQPTDLSGALQWTPEDL